MKIKIEICLDNAAFEPVGPELARILRKAAEDLQECDTLSQGESLGLRDINGNLVGIGRISRGTVKGLRA